MKTLCGVRVGDMKDPNPETRGLVDLVDVALQTSCEKFSYNLQKRNGA